MNKKIILYEPWARNTLHFEFNKCMLNIISEIYRDDEIIYCGDKEQIELLKKNIVKKNLEYKEMKILNYTSEDKLKLIVQEIKNLKEIKKIEAQSYFFINCLPHTLIFMYFLLPQKIKKYGILHGLDHLYNPKGIYRFFNLGIKLNQNNNIDFIVLGESIKNNLLKLFPKLEKKLYYIDHPYSFSENQQDEDNFKKNKLIIGTIGSATKEKGFLSYVDVIKNLNKNKFKFFHIGTINNLKINCKDLEIPSPEVPLLNEEYSKYISNLDFILYFYPKESYRLTASGAIFDALKCNKPIIAIKNEYFEYIFKQSGDFGFLFDTKEQIIEFLNQENINEIVSNELFKENIKKAKKIFSEENIKIQLENIIKNSRSE